MKNTLPLYIASEGTYADFLTNTAPLLETLASNQKQCNSCEEWFSLGEFEYPFYCDASQGMESETTEFCRECLRDENDRLQDERDAEDGFSQRAHEDHLQDLADTAAEFDDD